MINCTQLRDTVNASALAARVARALDHGVIPEFACLNDPDNAPDWQKQMRLPDSVSPVVEADVSLAGFTVIGNLIKHLPREQMDWWGGTVREIQTLIFQTLLRLDGDEEQAQALLLTRTAEVINRVVQEDFLQLTAKVSVRLSRDRILSQSDIEEISRSSNSHTKQEKRHDRS